MSTSHDVEKFDEKISDGQLVEMARSKTEPETALGALKELSRRKSGLRKDLYRAVLDDPQQSMRAKKFVIAELGTEVLVHNRELLLRQLDVQETALFRSVVRSLGKIGDEQALKQLEAVRTPRDTTDRRSLEFSRVLISYRLRLDRHLIPVPPAEELLEVTGGISFEVGKASQAELRRALGQVESDLPAIPLAQAGAARLTCRGSELLLVLSKGFLQASALATLRERNALPLVLLKSGLSLDRYILEGYFFTQPLRGGKRVALLGARPGGELTYAGSVESGEGGFAFTLRSLDTRYAPAIDVEGRYDPDKRTWEFSKAITSVEVASRKSPVLTPQRVSHRF